MARKKKSSTRGTEGGGTGEERSSSSSLLVEHFSSSSNVMMDESVPQSRKNKRKTDDPSVNDGNDEDNVDDGDDDDHHHHPLSESAADRNSNNNNNKDNNDHGGDNDNNGGSTSSDDDDENDDDDDEDDLVLEGVIVRNPDVSDSEDSSSSSDDDDDDDDNHDDNDCKEEEDTKPSVVDRWMGDGTKKRSNNASASNGNVKNKKSKKDDDDDDDDNNNADKKRKKKARRATSSGPEIIPVEFTFCDMDERYFHGLKTLLASSCPAVYGTNNHSSDLADLMIENVSVGTVVSTEADHEEGTVYGFASVLNVTTYHDRDCVKGLVRLCLSKCPPSNRAELETVLSGRTTRPAGLYLHGRMVNLPLEIVEVLHEQLVLDMDWAVDHAEGGEEERKSLNFGAFVRIAPTYRTSGVTYYKYFDDEILAGRAEFKYEIELPRNAAVGVVNETPCCMVMVLTKTGHRAAMEDLKTMVYGRGSSAPP